MEQKLKFNHTLKTMGSVSWHVTFNNIIENGTLLRMYFTMPHSVKLMSSKITVFGDKTAFEQPVFNVPFSAIHIMLFGSEIALQQMGFRISISRIT